MLRPFDLLAAAVLLAGHFSLCVWTFNRMHAGSLPHALVRIVDRIAALASIALFIGYAVYWARTGTLIAPWESSDLVGVWLRVHAALCLFVVIAVIPAWIMPRLLARPAAALASNQTRVIDLAKTLAEKPVHGHRSQFLASLPGNEILQLNVQEKELHVPNWPAALDGFSIVHLSDLHMTGKLTLPFYDAVFREVEQLKGDLVVATGDIAEEAECLPWIADTFGRIRGKYGQFFIFGNHELRLPDPEALRLALIDAGWDDLCGESRKLELGQNVELAGTAAPWFGGEPPAIDDATVKILLSHTPDHFAWARERKFDLMLAGHTHGGQIRLPLIGPLIAPSRYGFRFASGVFEFGSLVMHVSRGLSGEHLLRFKCPPELTKLTIRRGSRSAPNA